MRFFNSTDAVREYFEQKRDEAESARQRVHGVIMEYELRGDGDEYNRRAVQSTVREMGGIGYLREKRREHGAVRAAYDDAVRALNEIIPEADLPKFMQAGLVEDTPGQPPEQVEVSVVPLSPEFWERLAHDMKAQHGIDISFTEADDADSNVVLSEN